MLESIKHMSLFEIKVTIKCVAMEPRMIGEQEMWIG